MNWLFYNLGIPGFYEYDDWGNKWYRTWDLSPGGGGGEGSYGGGSGGGGGYYTGAGDPSYNGYLPGYAPSTDYGPGQVPHDDPFAPYPGGPSFGNPIYSTSLTYLINNLDLTQEQVDFLVDRK